MLSLLEKFWIKKDAHFKSNNCEYTLYIIQAVEKDCPKALQAYKINVIKVGDWTKTRKRVRLCSPKRFLLTVFRDFFRSGFKKCFQIIFMSVASSFYERMIT